MAEVSWTEPAIAYLDAIADYVALDNPDAARALVARVFSHIDQLTSQPESGSRPRELGSRSRYRQIVEPPCRVFYRYEVASERVFILYVRRGARLLRPSRLAGRERGARKA